MTAGRVRSRFRSPSTVLLLLLFGLTLAISTVAAASDDLITKRHEAGYCALRGQVTLPPGWKGGSDFADSFA